MGTPILPVRPSPQTRNFLALRRSASKRSLHEPGPDEGALRELLRIAMRVPDHRRLNPWRFLVFAGKDRDAFNRAALEILLQETPDATEAAQADTSQALTRAPVVVAVISSPDASHKTPVWEQELSTG